MRLSSVFHEYHNKAQAIVAAALDLPDKDRDAVQRDLVAISEGDNKVPQWSWNGEVVKTSHFLADPFCCGNLLFTLKGLPNKGYYYSPEELTKRGLKFGAHDQELRARYGDSLEIWKLKLALVLGFTKSAMQGHLIFVAGQSSPTSEHLRILEEFGFEKIFNGRNPNHYMHTLTYYIVQTLSGQKKGEEYASNSDPSYKQYGEISKA